MPDVRRPQPTSRDPLGEALHLLQLTGTLYCQSELTEPWGIDVPRLEGCSTFQIVTAGRCWLEVEGAPPRWLATGSLTLIPHGTPHRARSDPRAETSPLFDLPVQPITDRYETLHHGGGGARTAITYGVVRFDHVAAHRLLALLPTLLHIDTLDEQTDGWLQSTARWVTREARALRPGGETVITRLADLLVIQAIRAWIDRAPEAQQGWLAALRDDRVGRALAAMHRDPAHAWTVPSLSKEAGMSRSAFSARFTRLVGEPAMQYLTQWRMQLARTHLRDCPEPLGSVAARFGYGSEAAFCKAFKRTFGASPGSVRSEPRPGWVDPAREPSKP
ncbi:MAG: AraC family transcriptional regulator [Deltaproteobacteria bacterium]|nr:AraC family transcriptional regulator [Deltaproteobacteria bacterium]